MTGVRTALVIGGGIAGPVTALALRKAGIEATVHEAHPGPSDGVGAMLTVAPNGLNALKVVGADDVVRAVGQPVPGMVMGDSRGNRFVESPGLSGLPASQAMARSDLFRVLHDHAVANGVRVEHGKRLVGVDETPTGVTARFADGSTATADILIGADGIRSTVRTLIDQDAPGPEYGGVLSFGGIATGSGVPAEPGVMHFVFGAAFIGYWAQPDGTIVWFGSLPHAEPMTSAQAREVPSADWMARLRELYTDDDLASTLLAHSDPDELFVTGPMEMMPPVPHWHRGRMVLVGDSAHAPSSSSGQGASLAVESAIELARCLRDLPDASSAFAAYENLRRPRVESIAAAAARTNRKKAGEDAAPSGPPSFPTPEQMLGPVHRHLIDWDQTVTA
ncbi:NAD(P)-binding protein [Solihabitans fulvus]|uniref:NAD(P)-binding protein n=1 Tax=Solihabitans fulvus TaxID=1892852 RepID=A0A5B2X499_9PSEU|nr:FAD-dependent monooxygenase [Solihabitans fulvus]KAA2258137.1 NAD(P)-binding protein [Solihabitans fulvus]